MNHQVEKLILAAVALFAIRAMCEEVVDDSQTILANDSCHVALGG